MADYVILAVMLIFYLVFVVWYTARNIPDIKASFAELRKEAMNRKYGYDYYKYDPRKADEIWNSYLKNSIDLKA